MRSPWTRTVVAIAAVAAAGAAWLGHSTIRERMRGNLAESLAREANAAGEVLAQRWGAEGEPRRTARALARGLDAAVRVTGPGGSLLVQEGSTEIAEEVASRPEVSDARHSGNVRVFHAGGGVAGETWYAARRIERGERVVGLVLLGVPADRLSRSDGASWLGILLASFLPALAVAAAAAWVLRRERVAWTALVSEAERLVRENEPDLPDATGRQERGLTRSLGVLRERLSEISGQEGASRALTASVLQSMREGVLAVDEEERVVFHNSAVADLLGIRGGRPMEARLLQEMTRNAAVCDAYSIVLAAGRPEERKFRVDSASSERHVELRVVPLRDAAGERIGAIGVFFDVSRLEVLETIRRTFIANVSHELRTPLASIEGYTESLLESGVCDGGGIRDQEHARRFLEVVLRHARRMEALIDDLTDLSLMEAGAVALDALPVDLGGLVEGIVDDMEPLAGERDVRIVTDLPAGLQVRGDRRRLEQVLINVVENAVKFGPEGGTVRVTAWNTEEGPTISVEDEGPGIPPGALERVFNRFYRVDKARSRELGGTGLGLSIVKHLMRLHGGSARAENRAEGGARFILSFPTMERSPLAEVSRSEAV